MLYEVFDGEDWSPQTENLVLDEQAQAYHSGLEFEFGGSYSFQDMTCAHTLLTDRVNVTVVMTDRAGFRGEPDRKEYGEYTIPFVVLREDGQEFLRFVEIKSRMIENSTWRCRS